VVLALILDHRIFVSHDTVSNYAHVWYVARQIWHAHRLPFAMPIIGHGQALAFPYAFIPWLTAALVWPVFGDWAVTLWLVVGFVGVIVTTFWAFPELRKGWWAAAVLVNPALVLAPIVGQLPFLWASAFLFAAVACWRRGRRGWATTMAALAQVTHPAVLMPITLGVVAAADARRSLIMRYAVSAALALPAAYLVVASPVFSDSSTGTKISEFVGTVAMRAAVVMVPVVLVWLSKRVAAHPGWRAVVPLVFVALLLPNFAVGVLDTRFPWQALRLGTDTELLSFIHSDAFVPGVTYRVLRAHDGKMGMYQLIQHGGRLDSEFFPESIVRRSWPDEATYARFLVDRHVDFVIAFSDYTAEYQTNEIPLLGRLAASPTPTCAAQVGSGKGYTLYRVMPPC
jgi:hypothetical protein